MKLILLRHAECKKNLIGIPGGPGTALTTNGVGQAIRVAAEIGRMIDSEAVIHCCPPVQAIETGQILSTELGAPLIVKSELSSINLGVLSGVPIHEADEAFPASSASMHQWRQGKIEICDLSVEGAESFASFYTRVGRFIGHLQRDYTHILVCTTSVLIAVDSMSEHISARPGGGYRARSYENCEVIVRTWNEVDFAWLKTELDCLVENEQD